jgi:hypothetical protein
MPDPKNTRRILWAAVILVFSSFPQWLASVWSLFTAKPLYLWLQEKGIAMPHFSLLWITAPIGICLIGILVRNSIRENKKADKSFQPDDQSRKTFAAMVDLIKSDPKPPGQKISAIGALIEFSNDIRTECELEYFCREFEKLEWGHPFELFELHAGGFLKGRRLLLLQEARNKPQEIKTSTQFIDFLATGWSEKEKWREAQNKWITATRERKGDSIPTPELPVIPDFVGRSPTEPTSEILHVCSKCGFGFRVMNPFFIALEHVKPVATCPNCKHTEPIWPI